MQRDLVEYFNGKAKGASEAEKNVDAHQSVELQETIKVWEHASLDTSDYCPDVECAWGKVKSRLSVEKREFALRYFYWAAASLALIVGSYFVFQSTVTSQAFSETAVVNANEKVKEITLPDGSSVWLNANSQISYSEDAPRNIKLKGEAYFKVTHDVEHPFVVESNGMTAKVLGTEFNLKNTKEGVRLAVIDGTVEASALEKVLMLQKNQQVDVVMKDNVIRRSDITDMNFLSWKTGMMTFSNQPLDKVLKQVQDHYHADITLDNEALKACKLSVTLKNLSLQESLNVIATLLNGSVEQKGGSYVVLAEPCEN
ncbi:MAG: FecR domain-containing protein [Imperialibacter sp.]|uniref:FecR family protein n=1 Tax=Imperialibacter sp. TaxID=2038411 RepID=UPI0032EFF5A3